LSLTVIYRVTSIPGLARLLDADRDTFARVRRAIRALAEHPRPDGAAP
jgi:hypothetical protein